MLRIGLITGNKHPHRHKVYELITVTRGSGYISTGGKTVPLEPGGTAILPSGVEHNSWSDSDDFERISILGDFDRFFALPSAAFVSDTPRGEARMLAELISANRYSNGEYAEALTNALVHFLLQNIRMENEMFRVVRHIADTLSRDFDNSELNIGQLLRSSGYAEDYIRAQFKKITGKTPGRFLTEIRIKHACYMMEAYGSVLTLNEIAEKCGYTDYVYFSKRFKEITGSTPRHYTKTE
ncbi:MAG: helix-turn-helix domain-containing protein [Clostridia bacterium]|nr:helix-turn-helix domain-containing protein [Clostridia bacterium]